MQNRDMQKLPGREELAHWVTETQPNTKSATQ